MEITKENLEKSKVKLTIKISSSEMRSFFARVYNKLAPQVAVKGFRPGMAPKSMTIAAIGENRLNSEIINLALQETYSQALKKQNLLPIAPPKINIKLVKDLTVDTAELAYEAEIDLLPEVKIGDYKKIKVKTKKEKVEVTDDEVEQVLSHLARSQAKFQDISQPVKMGDRIEINFEGYDKGVKLDNLSSKNYPVILGSKVLIEDFEKELIGLKKGDKKEFSLNMPVISPSQKTSQDQLSQKKIDPFGKHRVNPKQSRRIDFKVEVLQAQKVILPKINDEFAKNYKKDNLSDLKKAIKNDLLKQKELEEEKKQENALIEELLKIIQVDVSQSLIDQEIDRQIADIRSRVAMMGLTFEKYLENLKRTIEEFRENLKPQAEKTVKVGLALGEIIKKEKIDPKNKNAGKLALNKLIYYATRGKDA